MKREGPSCWCIVGSRLEGILLDEKEDQYIPVQEWTIVLLILREHAGGKIPVPRLQKGTSKHRLQLIVH